MSAKVLKFCFWFAGSKLSLIPLKSSHESNGVVKFESLVIKPLVRYIWRMFLIFSLLITSYDLHHSFYDFETKNLVRIMYHIFMLLCKTASTITTFVFQEKSCEICKLLNYLFHKNSQNMHAKIPAVQIKRFRTLSFFLWPIITGVIVFYLFIIPLFAMAFPCVHNSPLVQNLFSDCTLLIFRITICLIQFLFMLPVSAMATSSSATILVTISELTRTLRNLW